jgi:hypothetical protein
MRAIGTALASLVMALAALGLAVAAERRGGAPGEPRAAIADASGALLISNSRAGQAILDTPPMAPGQTVGGAVRIGNAGKVAGRFSVRATGMKDTPGPYGGKLSDRLQLALVDVSGTPATVYTGTAAGLQGVDLGTFAAGAQRDYSLTATLPDTGVPTGALTGDNAFQGSAMKLDIQWNAVASGGGGGSNGGGGSSGGGSNGGGNNGGGGGTPPVTEPPAGGEVATLEVLGETLGLPSSKRCVSGRRMKIRLRAPGNIRVLAATVRVNGKLKKRVERFRHRTVKLKKLPKRRFRLTVRVRAANKRVYVSKRIYRACKPSKQKKAINRGWRKRAR